MAKLIAQRDCTVEGKRYKKDEEVKGVRKTTVATLLSRGLVKDVEMRSKRTL